MQQPLRLRRTFSAAAAPDPAPGPCCLPSAAPGGRLIVLGSGATAARRQSRCQDWSQLPCQLPDQLPSFLPACSVPQRLMDAFAAMDAAMVTSTFNSTQPLTPSPSFEEMLRMLALDRDAGGCCRPLSRQSAAARPPDHHLPPQPCASARTPAFHAMSLPLTHCYVWAAPALPVRLAHKEASSAALSTAIAVLLL